MKILETQNLVLRHLAAKDLDIREIYLLGLRGSPSENARFVTFGRRLVVKLQMMDFPCTSEIHGME